MGTTHLLANTGRRRSGSGSLEESRSISGKTIDAIVAERARFRQFLALRVSDSATAEDLMQKSLLQAIKQSDKLRRGESAVAWFYRILRNAINDHYRDKAAALRFVDRLSTEMQASAAELGSHSPEWENAICACFSKLLPTLRPRYAEIIRRIDLKAENKLVVAREMKIKRGTMDVLLHRARSSLRERLEVFCGACSRQKCLDCICTSRAS